MKLTIITTTYDREWYLDKGLYSVFAQEYKPFEVLVIDDGSFVFGGTKRVIKKWQEKHSNLRYIYNHNPGYKNCCLAQNIGIKESRGDVILMTNPEILHVGNSFGQHMEWHEKQDKIYVSGGTVYFLYNDAVGKLDWEQLRNPELITKLPEARDWPEGHQPVPEDILINRNVCAAFSASIRKEHLVAVGGFDERFQSCWGYDDFDLQDRLQMSGVDLISEPNIVSIHLRHGATGDHIPVNSNEILYKDKRKPMVANQGKKWGVIK